jgi:hypothetical protein
MVQKPPATTSHASKPPSGNAAGSGTAVMGAAFSESSAGPGAAAIDACVGSPWIEEQGELFEERSVVPSSDLGVDAIG